MSTNFNPDPYAVSVPGAYNSWDNSDNSSANASQTGSPLAPLPSLGFEFNSNYVDSSLGSAFSHPDSGDLTGGVSTQAPRLPTFASSNSSSPVSPGSTGSQQDYFNYAGPVSSELSRAGKGTAQHHSRISHITRSILPSVSPPTAQRSYFGEVGRSGTVKSHAASLGELSNCFTPSEASSMGTRRHAPQRRSSWSTRPDYAGEGYPEYVDDESPVQTPPFVYPEYDSASLVDPRSPVSSSNSSGFGVSVDMPSDDYRKRFRQRITNSGIGRSYVSFVQSCRSFSQASRGWWRDR